MARRQRGADVIRPVRWVPLSLALHAATLGGGVWAAREPLERALFMDLTLKDPDERAETPRGGGAPRPDVAAPAAGSAQRAAAPLRAPTQRPSAASNSTPSPAPPQPSAAAEPAVTPMASPPAAPSTPEIAASPSEPPSVPPPAPVTRPAPAAEPSPSVTQAAPAAGATTAPSVSNDAAASRGASASGDGAGATGLTSGEGTPGATAARGAGDGSALALAIPGDGGGEMYGAYLAALRRRLQETLEYPATARRRGLSGTVHLEISLESSGRVSEVVVVRSSSHSVLDDAALRAARSLARVPFPPDVRPRPLRVRLPVVFELR